MSNNETPNNQTNNETQPFNLEEALGVWKEVFPELITSEVSSVDEPLAEIISLDAKRSSKGDEESSASNVVPIRPEKEDKTGEVSSSFMSSDYRVMWRHGQWKEVVDNARKEWNKKTCALVLAALCLTGVYPVAHDFFHVTGASGRINVKDANKNNEYDDDEIVKAVKDAAEKANMEIDDKEAKKLAKDVDTEKDQALIEDKAVLPPRTAKHSVVYYGHRYSH